MDIKRLHKLVKNPSGIAPDNIPELEAILEEYPYFQAARVLLAKAKGATEAVVSAAAYTADRSILREIINSDFNPDFNLPNIDDLDVAAEDVNVFETFAKEEEALPIVEDDNFDAAQEDAATDNYQIQAEEESSEDQLPENLDIYVEELEAPTYFEGSPETFFDNDDDEVPELEALVPDAEDAESEETDEVYANLKALKASREAYEQDTNAVSQEDDNQQHFTEFSPEVPNFELPNYQADYNYPEDDDQAVQQVESPEAVNSEEEFEKKPENEIMPPIEQQSSPSLPDGDTKNGDENSRPHKSTPMKKADTFYPNPDAFALNELLEDIEKMPEVHIHAKSIDWKTQKTLIDKFIQREPYLKKSQPQEKSPANLTQEDLAATRGRKFNPLPSENLAIIYQKQGKTQKAIGIYQQLMLKYPNKSAYFASRIQLLKKDL